MPFEVNQRVRLKDTALIPDATEQEIARYANYGTYTGVVTDVPNANEVAVDLATAVGFSQLRPETLELVPE
jgi:hypothetical protein